MADTGSAVEEQAVLSSAVRRFVHAKFVADHGAGKREGFGLQMEEGNHRGRGGAQRLTEKKNAVKVRVQVGYSS